MDDIRVARIFDALSGGDRCAWMKQGRCGLAGPGWAGCWCYSRAQEVDAALPAEPALPAILRAHDRRVTELLEANNREVERRRAAEARVAELEAALARRQYPAIFIDGHRLRFGQTTINPLTTSVIAGDLAADRAEWDAAPRW